VKLGDGAWKGKSEHRDFLNLSYTYHALTPFSQPRFLQNSGKQAFIVSVLDGLSPAVFVLNSIHLIN
jgi:hypothetical protein